MQLTVILARQISQIEDSDDNTLFATISMKKNEDYILSIEI